MILFTLILIALHCIFLYKAIKHFRQAYKDNIEPTITAWTFFIGMMIVAIVMLSVKLTTLF